MHRVHYVGFDRKLLATPTIVPFELKSRIRRPLKEIDILYKVVGRGTTELTNVGSGSLLDLIGPVGNGFSIGKIKLAIIIAGGIGVAPLVALAERLRYYGSEVVLYLGALRRDLLMPVLGRRSGDTTVEASFAGGGVDFLNVIEEEFAEIGASRVRVGTDDGTAGEKGQIVDLLAADLDKARISAENANIFACGPQPMLRAASLLAKRYDLPIQVLMEERMACGVGACYSCTCRIQSEEGPPIRKRVCVDGPVFDGRKVSWSD